MKIEFLFILKHMFGENNLYKVLIKWYNKMYRKNNILLISMNWIVQNKEKSLNYERNI